MKRILLYLIASLLIHSGFTSVSALEASTAKGGASDSVKMKPPATLIRPGVRIRVHACATKGKPIIGTCVATKADSLRVKAERGNEDLAIPWSGLRKVEVFGGKKTHFRKGALYGLIGGMGAGIMLCFIDDATRKPVGMEISGVYEIVTMVFGAGGALFGTVAGGMISTEAWEAVPLDRVRLGIHPLSRHGAVLSASLRF